MKGKVNTWSWKEVRKCPHGFEDSKMILNTLSRNYLFTLKQSQYSTYFKKKKERNEVKCKKVVHSSFSQSIPRILFSTIPCTVVLYSNKWIKIGSLNMI